MSKARAQARAERAAEAARRDAAAQELAQQQAAERARRERWALTWRHLRLWQRGPASRRRREAGAWLATLVLVVLVTTYAFFGTFSAVWLMILVLIVVAPVLIMLSFSRDRK